MKILVVEDETELLNSITTYLAKEGNICEVATNCLEADQKLFIYQYDCIILDISLPDGNGLDLLEKVKKEKNTMGIIVISAKNSLDDKIKGLNLGADDYLPKPFHLSELNARVNAILRRIKFDGENKIELNDLILDLNKRSVFINDALVYFTRKEYELLLFLLSNKNRVIKKSSLIGHLWGDDIDQSNSYDFLYSQIKNLRKKLHDSRSTISIQAIYGIGYKLSCE